MAQERLQKIIAAAGITSRRKAEELIASGAVSVNGKIVTELGTKADSAVDHIKVNGKLLRGAEEHKYIVINKPKGTMTTTTDPEGRETVIDLLKGVKTRLYPVGRLDYNSEGLLLLTNDGDLAQKLTHASSHVPKVYLVKVSGVPDEAQIQKLRGGVMIEEGARGTKRVRTAPAGIKVFKDAENPWYEITLIEGRNRQIRKMFQAIGHHVEKIRRIQYGPLTLDLEPGEFRELRPFEITALKNAAAGRISKRPAAKLRERKRSIKKI
jgi:23S rRNA pseudouridine2605 synthase